MNNTDYVSAFVKNHNDHTKSVVTIKELKIHENSTLITPLFTEAVTPITPILMPDHFTFTHKHGELPATLQPEDVFSFVIKVKPNYKHITDASYEIPESLSRSRRLVSLHEFLTQIDGC